MQDRLYKLLAKVLQIEVGMVGPGFSRKKASTWDSLRHINLVIAIENEFGVTFDLSEIAELTTVEAIGDALKRKIA